MVWSRGAVAMMGVLALAGCAAPQPGGPGPGSGPVTGLSRPRPDDLVGLWRVQARGEEAGTILRLGSDLSIWRRCDDLFGEWRADAAGEFLGDTNGSSYECAGPKVKAAPKPPLPSVPSTPDWLLRAVAYRVDGTDRLLLDARGGVVARLTPSGEPGGRHVAAPETYARPVLDDALRRRLAPAAALPAKLRPATAAELVGTWKPAAPGANPAQYVTIKADGSWQGSDGCNAHAGRWTADEPGAVLTVAGASTAMACAGVDGAPQFEVARGAGFDGTTLVLIDARGEQVGRLKR